MMQPESPQNFRKRSTSEKMSFKKMTVENCQSSLPCQHSLSIGYHVLPSQLQRDSPITACGSDSGHCECDASEVDMQTEHINCTVSVRNDDMSSIDASNHASFHSRDNTSLNTASKKESRFSNSMGDCHSSLPSCSPSQDNPRMSSLRRSVITAKTDWLTAISMLVPSDSYIKQQKNLTPPTFASQSSSSVKHLFTDVTEHLTPKSEFSPHTLGTSTHISAATATGDYTKRHLENQNCSDEQVHYGPSNPTSVECESSSQLISPVCKSTTGRTNVHEKLNRQTNNTPSDAAKKKCNCKSTEQNTRGKTDIYLSSGHVYDQSCVEIHESQFGHVGFLPEHDLYVMPRKMVEKFHPDLLNRRLVFLKTESDVELAPALDSGAIVSWPTIARLERRLQQHTDVTSHLLAVKKAMLLTFGKPSLNQRPIYEPEALRRFCGKITSPNIFDTITSWMTPPSNVEDPPKTLSSGCPSSKGVHAKLRREYMAVGVLYSLIHGMSQKCGWYARDMAELHSLAPEDRQTLSQTGVSLSRTTLTTYRRKANGCEQTEFHQGNGGDQLSDSVVDGNISSTSNAKRKHVDADATVSELSQRSHPFDISDSIQPSKRKSTAVRLLSHEQDNSDWQALHLDPIAQLNLLQRLQHRYSTTAHLN